MAFKAEYEVTAVAVVWLACSGASCFIGNVTSRALLSFFPWWSSRHELLLQSCGAPCDYDPRGRRAQEDGAVLIRGGLVSDGLPLSRMLRQRDEFAWLMCGVVYMNR